ncbi:hypothetical protein BS47DRAFT_997720 [Hydnum rufescens UP504]|uniref:Uncharacterized protein n=1 Tax=Hydnum rufescens UP504 TaxID=1448309 RepID=A0A9P6BBL7_9AGAM|nr:hypothetical protein BS47DRAFT_997720 [Hydnum rufescens UP504]
MLFAETKSKSTITTAGSAAQNGEALKDALRRDTEYQKYIKSLSKVGYFEGELEGSQRWRSLETRAAQAWVDMRREDNASRRSFASAVIDAIAEATATASSGSISLDFNRGEDSDRLAEYR